MKKIGVLTFHYSTNYGGVLQAFALHKTLINKGYDAEIINFIPNNYKPNSYFKPIIKEIIEKRSFNSDLIKKCLIKKKYNKIIKEKFDEFRKNNFIMSDEVNEKTIINLLQDYDTIIVGSDQVWNPSQRKRKEYFLDFNKLYTGKKVSYAADSTVREIDVADFDNLKKIINEFNAISVRNQHSFEFVQQLTNKEIQIVADPTILYNFNQFINFEFSQEKYILAYILGEEIYGSHQEAISKIKEKYGDIPVYLITIPSQKFNFHNFADKVIYDAGPLEWLNLINNATYVYTDSFHGVLFSLKFHKPFLAYYTEKMRATRFIDLAIRYKIDNFIVECTADIDKKKSIDQVVDFNIIDKIFKEQQLTSLQFIENVLREQ